MAEPSTSTQSSDAEREEMLDRMLTRLALADDSKLEQLLSKILPYSISSLSTSSPSVRKLVNHCFSYSWLRFFGLLFCLSFLSRNTQISYWKNIIALPDYIFFELTCIFALVFIDTLPIGKLGTVVLRCDIIYAFFRSGRLWRF